MCMNVTLPKSLRYEMEDGSFAVQYHPDIFAKMVRGAPLTAAEVPVALEGLYAAADGLEAVACGGGLDFSEARTVAAARRSCESLIRTIESRFGQGEE